MEDEELQKMKSKYWIKISFDELYISYLLIFNLIISQLIINYVSQKPIKSNDVLISYLSVNLMVDNGLQIVSFLAIQSFRLVFNADFQ